MIIPAFMLVLAAVKVNVVVLKRAGAEVAGGKPSVAAINQSGHKRMSVRVLAVVVAIVVFVAAYTRLSSLQPNTGEIAID